MADSGPWRRRYPQHSVLPVRVPEGYLKPRGLLASNASGAAPCRSARHTGDAAGRPRPPYPCIRRIQRDRNDSLLREMQRQRDRAKHRAANERCSDDYQLFHEISPAGRLLIKAKNICGLGAGVRTHV